MVSVISDLSQRQVRIGKMVAQGYTNRDIAGELAVSDQVVKNILHRMFDKLGIWNRVELANRFVDGSAAEGAKEEFQQQIEAERVKVVRELEILDTRFENIFDEMARLACSLCNAPVGIISLIDSDRVWFKAQVGLDFVQMRRNISFCGHTIQESRVFVVRDALKDRRFVRNPLVTAKPKIRFYAGAPMITTEGYAMGSLCVIDHVPRKLSRKQIAGLESLAKVALEQIQVRRELLHLRTKALPAPQSIVAIAA